MTKATIGAFRRDARQIESAARAQRDPLEKSRVLIDSLHFDPYPIEMRR